MRQLLLATLIALMPLTALAQDRNKALAAIISGDYATALKELRPLAEKGDAQAQYNLGVMYYTGDGVAQDYAEALRWYRLAAEQGYASAQFFLFFTGVPVENGEAAGMERFKWLLLAASKGRKYRLQWRSFTSGFWEGGSSEVAEMQRLAHEWTEEHLKLK